VKKFWPRVKINLTVSSTNFGKVLMKKPAKNVIRLFMTHL